MKRSSYATVKEEKSLWKRGFRYVAGVDEVGIGPLAGSVTAAAIILPFPFSRAYARMFSSVRDSKKMSPERREAVYTRILSLSEITFAVSSVSVSYINKKGIYSAREQAVVRCLRKLKVSPDFIVFDGNRLPISRKYLPHANVRAIVKADEKVLSCALASILAKVTRDRLMVTFHKIYPHYRFDAHKGYGTKMHVEMLKRFGPSPIHRTSFRPVREYIFRERARTIS